MSTVPPVPPRPYETASPPPPPPPPPPLPPLPPNILESYSLPHFDNPLIAPKPHNPANMAQTLDDQLPSRNPWPSHRSMANLTFQSKPLSPQPSLPSLTAPLPNLAQLQSAASIIQSPTHDPALKVAWCRDVFFLIDLAQQNTVPGADPPVGPAIITDPLLSRLAQIAVPLLLQLSQSHNPAQGKIPPFIAEAISIRATLAATGAFPDFVKHNPRSAFRDFETAARGGFPAAWFKLGRDYENFNDHVHARDCFERGVRLNVESCLYRMGMAHLLGQLSLQPDPTVALPLLHRAATLATLQVPQPAYVYALLLLSEFTQITVPLTLFAPLIPPSSSPTLEARKHLERAAFLHFPAAQYKLGHAYEFAEPPFPFDPLLSVQYYSLASEKGEAEADMALSKWFLCGSGGAAGGGGPGGAGAGAFEKDEALALTFADKAARKGLPSAEFAMGYYAEVGVGRPKDIKAALGWYQLAHEHGNPDATMRLSALSAPSGQSLSRQEHDTITETKLVRKRTLAAQRSENQPQSPPWDGKTFPTMGEAQAAAPTIRDGRVVVDGIRKNSLAPPRYDPPPSTSQSAPPMDGSPPRPYLKRYTLSDTTSPSPPPGPNSSNNPNRFTTSIAPSGGRPPSPGRRLRKGNEHNNSSASIASNNTSSGSGYGLYGGGVGRSPSPGRNTRLRLNLDDIGPVPTLPTASSSNPHGARAGSGDNFGGGTPMLTATPGTGKYPATFAEMGIHGAKADEKECTIM
ncbi:HCP-like protein [Phlegmacium glaucopus]|nr:HCP-like protein [Phlegmacium glaucopus]